MLHSLISVDMKVYALQLKQKSTKGVSKGIFQNFRTDSFENNFGGQFLKENKERVGRAATLIVSGFHLFQGSYFDYVIYFYVPKILVVEIFGCYQADN